MMYWVEKTTNVAVDALPGDATLPLPPGVTEVGDATRTGSIYREHAPSLELAFARRTGPTAMWIAVCAFAIVFGASALRRHATWDVICALVVAAVGAAAAVIAGPARLRLSVDGLQVRGRPRRLALPISELVSFHTVQSRTDRRDPLGANQSTASYHVMVRTRTRGDVLVRMVATPEHGWAIQHRLTRTLARLPRG